MAGITVSFLTFPANGDSFRACCVLLFQGVWN
jgi:hypothetical protein